MVQSGSGGNDKVNNSSNSNCLVFPLTYLAQWEKLCKTTSQKFQLISILEIFAFIILLCIVW